MPTFNLRYDLEAPGILPGMVADSRLTHTITGVANSAINPGQAVGWDNDPLDTDAVMQGVARLETSYEQTDAGVVQYEAGDAVPLVSFGPIAVTTTGAVNAGEPAYVVTASGLFTNTAGAGTTTAAVGYFETTLATAGTAVLFVQRGV